VVTVRRLTLAAVVHQDVVEGDVEAVRRVVAARGRVEDQGGGADGNAAVGVVDHRDVAEGEVADDVVAVVELDVQATWTRRRVCSNCGEDCRKRSQADDGQSAAMLRRRRSQAEQKPMSSNHGQG